MLKKLACLVLVLAACGGSSDPGPMPDAKVFTNQPFGGECTMVTDMGSTECTSGVCSNSFTMIPHPVCTQKCTVLGGMDTTCPMGSMGQKCSNGGYCRP